VPCNVKRTKENECPTEGFGQIASFKNFSHILNDSDRHFANLGELTVYLKEK
jgi:hypothetical protein